MEAISNSSQYSDVSRQFAVDAVVVCYVFEWQDAGQKGRKRCIGCMFFSGVVKAVEQLEPARLVPTDDTGWCGGLSLARYVR